MGQQLELRFYDLAVRTLALAEAADLAIVAIDAGSLAAVGPQPWARDVHGRMVERLGTAGAKTIGYTPALTEQPMDHGLAHVRRIREAWSRLDDQSPLSAEVGRLVKEAESALDGEQRLARAVQQSGNVLLSFAYSSAGALASLPAFVLRNAPPGQSLQTGRAQSLPCFSQQSRCPGFRPARR